MKSITERFLMFYQYMKSIGIIKNASEFAQNVGVSNSMMTELSKKRSQVGIELIHNTVKKYGFLNSHWILTGDGEMLLKNAPSSVSLDEKSSISAIKKHVGRISKEVNESQTASPTASPTSENAHFSAVNEPIYEGRNNIIMIDIKAAAGLPENLAEPLYYKDFPRFSLPGFRYKMGEFMCIQIDGDSMHPTVKHQEYIVASPVESYADIKGGEVYIIITKDSVLCKRLYFNKGTHFIECHSDNEMYTMLPIPLEDIQRIYKATDRITSDFRNWNNDIRKEIRELRDDMSIMKRTLKIQ